MKIATILTTLLGVWGASAAVLAESAQDEEAQRQYCQIHGQPCWKVKRAASAFADALHSSADLTTRDVAGSTDPAYLAARDLSNLPGGAAYTAKRAADALAAVVASTQADPDAFYNSLFLDSYFHPDTTSEHNSGKTKRDADEEKRQYCPIRGQPCWKKRDASAVEADKRWCNEQGNACWTAKRAAEALASAVDGFEVEAKRDAAPEMDVEKRQYCRIKGQSCWKRDVAFEPIALGRRDVSSADVSKRRYCPICGQPCWKRDETSGLEARCHSPSGDCTKAARDLQAVRVAARDLLASLE